MRSSNGRMSLDRDNETLATSSSLGTLRLASSRKPGPYAQVLMGDGSIAEA
jgi:hypothetical protein